MKNDQKLIEQYLEAHTSPEPPLLQEINRTTYLKMTMPRMLSGHVEGRFLTMVSQMVRPKKVLEVGTFTGYSAICLAEGIREGGALHTIEINEELEQDNREKFKKSGFGAVIVPHTGNALEIIPQLGGASIWCSLMPTK